MSDLVKRLRDRAAAAREEPNATALWDAIHFEEAADRIEELERELERWRQGSIDTWGAMNAMRNAINEHVAMPSIEGDLLKGPENSIFCATVADAVIGAVLSLRSQLAAEKALADGLFLQLKIYEGYGGWNKRDELICAAYRKARGM